MSYFRWKPYVPVAKRRANAARQVKQLQKKGKAIEPVTVTGRNIAHTFWGQAWCDHLERFSDFANRLPRGRTYVRNGSVCHLGIGAGRIEAIVSGSELYDIAIAIKPLPEDKWQKLRERCTGKIGSLLELLQGRFSGQVMEIVTDREQGLFPLPGEIEMSCSCPDWADLCKHLAAVLYGVGARLDQRPELLFELRGVDHQELISADIDLGPDLTRDLTRPGKEGGKHRRLETDDLADVFGIELDAAPAALTPRPSAPKKTGKTSAKPATPNEEFRPTAAAVTRLRERFGMSKTQFADLVGVSSVTIGNWEKADGELRLRRVTLRSLQEVAGLTPRQAAKRLGR